MYDDLDLGMKRAILRLYRATNDFGAMVERVEGLPAFKQVPTLVVWGTGDRYLPVKYAEQQRRFFDVQEVRLFERCGHWPFIDEPERAAEALTGFLGRVRAC
jgi:pimeloyl-ACP methyl ester carboxylesterase